VHRQQILEKVGKKNDVEQITKADRLTRGTPFAEEAKPAPCYGGLVPPFYS